MAEVVNAEALTFKANQLHAYARNGTLTLPSGRYVFTFDRSVGTYEVTCDNDPTFTLRLNTRKITEARALLREHTGETR